MNVFKYSAGFAAIVVLSACAPFGQQQQQPWGGQPYGYGGGNQQPYGYGNQQSYGNGNQGGSTMGGAVQMVLLNILMGQLGLNQLQAMGGAGSIFQVAQQRMQPADFSRLSAAVPEMDQYLAAAPRPANAANGNLGSLLGLAENFQSLGMSPDMIGRFVPVMLQHVQQQGGQGTMLPLQNALR